MRQLALSSFVLLAGCAPALTPLFDKPITMSGGRTPQYASVADLNGDGKQDLVVTRSWGGGEVTIYLGKGDGTFQEPQRLVGAGSPRGGAVTDLNGDGKLDLAVAGLSTSHTVDVLLGKGDGSFEEPRPHLIGLSASSVKAGDFNGDGKVDLLAINSRPASTSMGEEFAGKLVFLPGRGDGGFDAPQMMPLDGVPLSLAVGDWDGDGKLDAMIPEDTRRDIYYLRGRGDGSFALAAKIHSRFDPVGIAPPADFDKDGHLDLLVSVTGGLSLFLGEGGGAFHHHKDIYTEQTRSGWTADFDKDGHLDIVTGRRFLRGDGAGNFIQESLPHLQYNDAWVTAADFNGDGWTDVASVDMQHNKIEVYLNTGAAGGVKHARR